MPVFVALSVVKPRGSTEETLSETEIVLEIARGDCAWTTEFDRRITNREAEGANEERLMQNPLPLSLLYALNGYVRNLDRQRAVSTLTSQ
jgi:hypothetical protein